MGKSNDKFADDKTVDLLRQLNTAFDKDNNSEGAYVSKWDPGTGTYYADEELAKKKVAQPMAMSREKKEELQKAEQMRKRYEEKKKVEKPVRKGYAAVEIDKSSKWQSGRK